MDDDIAQGWSIPPEMRHALRRDHVQKLLDKGYFSEAALEAEELLDETPDDPQGLRSLATAQLGMLDAEGAILTYEQLLLVIPQGDAAIFAGLATARFDVCDLEGAIKAARKALRLQPDLATAHYFLGLALERTPSGTTEAAQSFVVAHRLDPVSFPFPMRVDPQAWEQILATAMLHISPEIRDFWDGISVRLHELPPLKTLATGDPAISPRVLGMYQGTPPIEANPWEQRPDALLLFKRHLSRVNSFDELIERVADVLEQECFSWIGQDEWAEFEHLSEPEA